MPLKIKETPTVQITKSQMNRLRDEYERAFAMYCGAPPDFEEWAIRKLKERGQP